MLIALAILFYYICFTWRKQVIQNCLPVSSILSLSANFPRNNFHVDVDHVVLFLTWCYSVLNNKTLHIHSNRIQNKILKSVLKKKPFRNSFFNCQWHAVIYCQYWESSLSKSFKVIKFKSQRFQNGNEQMIADIDR